jgi:hypothetical protein
MFTQIIDVGSRRFLAWNARSPRLGAASHVDRRFLGEPSAPQLVSEFKSKLRQTEDLLSKLGFSLREIYRDQGHDRH